MSTNDNNIPGNLPSVTVIIANHNYGKYIEDAIQSVVQQDYANKNLVIVDDGSTDGSAEKIIEILERLFFGESFVKQTLQDGITVTKVEKPFPIFAVCCEKASGPAMARNVAIQLMFGNSDYFAILDADDYWLPNKISHSVEKVMNNPSVGVVYTDNYAWSPETNVKVREFREPFDGRRLLQHNMVHSGSLISRKALETVGGYDPQLRVAEDYDLWIRISECFNIVHLPEALVVSRVHPENASNSVKMDTWQKCWQIVGQKMQARRSQNAKK